MGMMNNCYYRIKMHTHVSSGGEIGIRFQHPAPVEVGQLGNAGWREEEKLAREVCHWRLAFVGKGCSPTGG